ncbi:MAG: YgiT-type zinc finger protein [Clostridia bacterium]|nr:YgiT-type zinc finger protein [Clostridia bacterium]
MKCIYCKGDIETKETNYIADLGKCIIVVRNVPTQVCRQCGEKSYS